MRFRCVVKRPNLRNAYILIVIAFLFEAAAFQKLDYSRHASHSRQRSRNLMGEHLPVVVVVQRHQQQQHSYFQLHAASTNNPKRAAQGKSKYMVKQQTQLDWVVRSMDKIGKTQGPPSAAATAQVRGAMISLLKAKTPGQVAEIGRKIDALNIVQTESRPIQERVMEALTLAGLVQNAFNLLNKMLDDGYLPSAPAYTSVCHALRRIDKQTQLEQVLLRIADLSREQGRSAHPIGLNIYLASLCKNCETPNDPRLTKARNLLLDGESNRIFNADLDLHSFNTVLGAAVRARNATLASDILKGCVTAGIEPDICTFNSLMRIKTSEERLAMLHEIENHPTLIPDQYTIDMVMFPLIQEGRIGTVEALLDDFISSSPRRVAADAFSAFLVTLVKRGELSSAQALFETYVLPSLRSTTTTSKKQFSTAEWKIIQPQTRHFNILIGGYARLCSEGSTAEEASGNFDGAQTGHDDSDLDEFRSQGKKLYSLMVKGGLRPDDYTLTTMMSLCSTSDELTSILQRHTHDFRAPALRAAMTMYGKLGDAASACVIFENYCATSSNSRFHNTLMVALASSAKMGDDTLDLDSCSAASTLGRTRNDGINKASIYECVQGRKSSAAAVAILDIMHGPSNLFPRPNSQTFCTAASAMQHGPTDSYLAIDLFRKAINSGIPADGRFINAIFRCFGDDIETALLAWKNEIRHACLDHESRTKNAPATIHRSRSMNLIAAYHGLLYVCGRALRPEIALRVAYAMNRESIEPNDVALNCYRSGKRLTNQLNIERPKGAVDRVFGVLPRLASLQLVDQYETLLEVECSRYNEKDKRRAGEKRVRIIV